MEGSSLLMKRLHTDDTFFVCLDLSSGYPQITLVKESRDCFAIILPQGKFRYTVLPQGASPLCDVFNILTDKSIQNKLGYLKNLDDILTLKNNIHTMEDRLRAILNLCRQKNIKLNPLTFDSRC